MEVSSPPVMILHILFNQTHPSCILHVFFLSLALLIKHCALSQDEEEEELEDFCKDSKVSLSQRGLNSFKLTDRPINEQRL